MKTKIILFMAALLFAFASSARAESVDTLATYAVLVDVGTGTVLLDKNAHAHMPTSSMSKTMTLYMVFDALKQGRLKLTDELPVSEKAWKMEGSRTFLKVGSRVKVEDLICGVAIQSGNDAAVTLAEGLGGTEGAFVDMMNARAKELGLNDSHFMNATGLPDPNHYSSAYDLAMIAQHLIKDFPEYYHYFGEMDFTYNKIHQPNRDPLLGKVPGADGVKTGHTDIAGYSLIGSALRNGRRLIVVVNGLPSEQARGEEGAKILEWGFRNFENMDIVKKSEQVDIAKVWLGRQQDVPLVAANDIDVVVPIAKRTAVKLTVDYIGPLKAPIRKGDTIGKLRIDIPDQQPLEVNLLAGSDVARMGVFGRVAGRFHYLLTGND